MYSLRADRCDWWYVVALLVEVCANSIGDFSSQPTVSWQASSWRHGVSGGHQSHQRNFHGWPTSNYKSQYSPPSSTNDAWHLVDFPQTWVEPSTLYPEAELGLFFQSTHPYSLKDSYLGTLWRRQPKWINLLWTRNEEMRTGRLHNLRIILAVCSLNTMHGFDKGSLIQSTWPPHHSAKKCPDFTT